MSSGVTTTPSEEYLLNLAFRSFLSLWSYPNPGFGDPERKDGKELCDLLVVFKNNILVFSDKSCKYPEGTDRTLNWKRWYDRSIKRSINQLLGAKRLITTKPQQIFLDVGLTAPFPLSLSAVQDMRVFLIAVAHESKEVCKARYGRDSLAIDTRLDCDELEAAVGCFWGDEFVHVLDDSTLEIIFSKLDTLPDFIDYLTAKERAFRAKHFVIHGEENLLAKYLRSFNAEMAHDIPTGNDEDGLIQVESGLWTAYVASDRYAKSVAENLISYNIDNIIEHYTTSYFDREMVVGQDKNVAYHENGLRILASESRFGRRTVAAALASILNEPDCSTFWSTTVPSYSTAGLRYVFVTYPKPPSGTHIDDVERYISDYLGKHMIVARSIFGGDTTIVGIALPNPKCGLTSICMHILDATTWTLEDVEYANYLRKEEGIFSNLTEEKYFHVE